MHPCYLANWQEKHLKIFVNSVYRIRFLSIGNHLFHYMYEYFKKDKKRAIFRCFTFQSSLKVVCVIITPQWMCIKTIKWEANLLSQKFVTLPKKLIKIPRNFQIIDQFIWINNRIVMIFYKLFVHLFCVIFWATLVLSKPILNQELIKSRNCEPKKNIFDLTLKRVTLAPDGFTRSLATINGQYPGPTIEAKKGDRIVINVRNELGEPTCKLQRKFFLVPIKKLDTFL